MQSPKQVMDQHYIEARSKLLDVAAILDRYDRAAEAASNGQRPDPRLANLRNILALINSPQKKPDRAEQVLNLLSLPFEAIQR